MPNGSLSYSRLRSGPQPQSTRHATTTGHAATRADEIVGERFQLKLAVPS